MAPVELDELRKLLEELLEAGDIKASKAPHAWGTHPLSQKNLLKDCAIEREESEVTSGLSAFPVQMNKAVFSLYVAVSGNVVEFALVVSYVF